jgi:hypothetical protein
MKLFCGAIFAIILSSASAAEAILKDYEKWALKITPSEFRGGNHKPGKSSDYFVKLEIVVSDKIDKSAEKTTKELLTSGPVPAEPLAWRLPTDSELNDLVMDISGEDYRKSLGQAMAKAGKLEDQFTVELKFTAFKKPLIPYFQKPEILGSTSIKPEDYLESAAPTNLEIPLGLGGILKYKLMPVGMAKK